MSENTRSGYVALIGQPNVGKSTLLNSVLGRKISITSRKPQTTRDRILGIKTIENLQIIYVDTPGLHLQGKRGLNQHMNKVARQTLREVNVIVFMVEALHWNDRDEWALKQLQYVEVPVILAINKIDKVKNNQLLLPFIEKIATKFAFHKIVPISAEKKSNWTHWKMKLCLACLKMSIIIHPSNLLIVVIVL